MTTVTLYTCQNCEYRTTNVNDLVADIPHYHERVEEGEEEPDGECPDCGALCHGEEREIPHDEDGSNNDEAQFAEEAMLKYGRESGNDLKTDGQYVVGGLIAAVRHWCDRNDVDFDASLRDSYERYASDIKERTPA